MDLKNIITYNINFQLEKRGHRGTELIKHVAAADKDFFETVIKISSHFESDIRFSDVLTSFNKFGVSEDTFLVVLHELLIGELNWARVLSVVALSGALAVQCAENGEEHKIDLIQDWTSSFAEVKLRPWIENNNGMEGLRQYFSPPAAHVSDIWERKKLLAAGACGAVGVVVGLFVVTRA